MSRKTKPVIFIGQKINHVKNVLKEHYSFEQSGDVITVSECDIKLTFNKNKLVSIRK